MPASMTPRERWLAALRCEPVDRLPFWPKIDAAYAQHQAEPFRNMNTAELHRWIGSDQHAGVAACVKVVRKKTSTRAARTNGTRVTEYITPMGTLTATDRFDAASCSWHPVEFPVKRREDIQIMSLFFSDATCEFDNSQFEQASAAMESIGENAVATTGIGISPLMNWVQHLAGIENAYFMLWDCREDVEELFREMHGSLCRRAEIVAEKCPAPVVYSVENTSTTLISPDLFRKYCYKHLSDYGNILSSAGKLHLLHMCGHLAGVLADVARLPAAGIEAFTSPPVGNTPLNHGRTVCWDKCLIGGTNAVLWTKTAAEIYDQVSHDLDELPHQRGVVVTSAGVMPPLCKPETIREVAELVKSYPAS